MNKNSEKIDAIKKIALNKEESEKNFQRIEFNEGIEKSLCRRTRRLVDWKKHFEIRGIF